MTMARLLTMGLPNVSVSLKNVVLRYLKVDIDKGMQAADWSGVLTPEHRRYAIADVEVLVKLIPLLGANIKTAYLYTALAIESDILDAVVEMESTGLPFDAARLQSLIDDLASEAFAERNAFLFTMDEALPLENKLPRLLDKTFNEDKKTGFNIASPKQLLEKLTLLLGTPPLDPATGKPSVSKGALREYVADNRAIYHYMNWKRNDKYGQMASSLLSSIAADGRVHASYMQLGADTSRFSCREPNLQQVPRDKRFRNAAVAPEGWSFVVADYSQLELRLVAWISRDEVMIEAFRCGQDLHTITAQTIYGVATPTAEQRQVGKSANFGLAYGAGAQGLRIYAGSCGITMTQERAAEIRDRWLDLYTGVASWIEECGRQAGINDQKEKSVRIPVSGHRRLLVGDNDRKTVRTNTPVQGAGAAILKVALANMHRYAKADPFASAKISACVHDEIILLVRDDQAAHYKQKLEEVMLDAERQWLGDIVPSEVTVGIGRTWGSAK